ncbi:GNAT family N-acetyltransferase [Allomuricauda sp. d1]|uniref:GNAT family N-acetyltransferase n=1 Tax=Allomuricauda sp. d1 TaxID=3136725 RepID=UPI0031D6162B
MENVVVRDATLADLSYLKQFEQALIKAERPFDPTIHPDPVSYYDLENYVTDENVKVVVAEIANEIVASGYALRKKARHYLDHDDYGYLGFMYTKPSHRGKGINQKLTETLKKWCIDRGLVEIRLTVYHDNVPAIKAYEKSGFKSHINEMRLRLNE